MLLAHAGLSAGHYTGRVHGRKYADLGPVPFILFCLPHELAHCVFPEWSQLISVALFPLMGRV